MRRRAALLGLVAAVAGCGPAGALLAGLKTASDAIGLGQVVGSFLDVADDGQRAYFRRHPSLWRQNEVDAGLTAARKALAAYDAAVRASSALEAGDMAAAKEALLKAYGALRGLLKAMGVLDATPPLGGAETDAAMPQPFELPTVADLEPVA